MYDWIWPNKFDGVQYMFSCKDEGRTSRLRRGLRLRPPWQKARKAKGLWFPDRNWKRKQILQILFALFRFSPPLLWARLLHVSTHMNAANQLPTNPKKVVPLCLSHYSTPLLSTVVCLPRLSKLSSNLPNYCWHLSIFVRCLGSVCEQALGPHPHAQTPQAHCAGSLNLQHCPDQLLQQNFWSWHSA